MTIGLAPLAFLLLLGHRAAAFEHPPGLRAARLRVRVFADGRLRRLEASGPSPPLSFVEDDFGSAGTAPGRQRSFTLDDLEFRAGDFQQDLFLQRDFVRHHRSQVVTACACHRGQADPGVAGSRLDQAATTADLAFLFQLSQHRPGRAIFDRAERIIPLQLGIERELRPWIHLVDPHHRRRVLLAGQQLEDIVIDACLMAHS